MEKLENFRSIKKAVITLIEFNIPAGDGRTSSQIEHLCFAAMLC